MVSFQCEGCGDVLTKKKLDPHKQRCYDAFYTCLDCMTTFQGTQYRSHTSCISEAQKYQGSLYKDKNARSEASRSSNTSTNTSNAPKATRAPPETQARPAAKPSTQLARVDAPPPAPSPPNAHLTATPANVSEYLGGDRSPSFSATSADSSDNQRPDRHQQKAVKKAYSSPLARASPGAQSSQGPGYTYGSGPVPKTMQRFASDLVDASQSRSGLGAMVTETRTPAPQRHDEHNGVTADATDPNSSKKRKRVQREDNESVAAGKPSTTQEGKTHLHSGLTGGLSRLLERSERHVDEPSPLNPKKETRQAQTGEQGHGGSRVSHSRTERDDGPYTKKTRYRYTADDESSITSGPRRQDSVADSKSGSRKLQATKAPPRHRLSQSRSSFFLSLVDKPHSSNKGQSIWGTLKSFHEGVVGGTDGTGYRESGIRDDEEKRLMKGLRMKVNKDGDVVLFAKGDREDRSVSPGTEMVKY
ncbi:MAG: hypothetical protein M1828_000015 [Chrysothrix sp. TS-e1954]|nr:MAG: hypothetical protein M1828_000015 [Chrysothrix sp. TS-e1954]